MNWCRYNAPWCSPVGTEMGVKLYPVNVYIQGCGEHLYEHHPGLTNDREGHFVHPTAGRLSTYIFEVRPAKHTRNNIYMTTGQICASASQHGPAIRPWFKFELQNVLIINSNQHVSARIRVSSNICLQLNACIFVCECMEDRCVFFYFKYWIKIFESWDYLSYIWTNWIL